jgi:hypothetical protein
MPEDDPLDPGADDREGPRDATDGARICGLAGSGRRRRATRHRPTPLDVRGRHRCSRRMLKRPLGER